MSKSTFFSGQPVFGQLLSLIPKGVIDSATSKYQSDRYYKKFDTWHHLATMMFASYSDSTSLREVVNALLGMDTRLNHFGFKHVPTRSTLADANMNRDYLVFEEIFNRLVKRFRPYLPDSRSNEDYLKNLILMDSTTISLFKEILKAAGANPKNGKRKGGIKVHMAVRAQDDVPCLIKFSASAASDKTFMKHVNPPKGSVLVFDKGYNDYKRYNEWKTEGVDWVTRKQSNAVIEFRSSRLITKVDISSGVISDEDIIMGHKTQKHKVHCRLITFHDKKLKRDFEFITSHTEFTALQIADIYKRRWQIELLFRRLKQNMPLMNFLGDNENAIKIQIYCALISDLLIQLIKRGAKKGWYYSNIASLIRVLLVCYFDVQKFLAKSNYKKTPGPSSQQSLQITLFSG